MSLSEEEEGEMDGGGGGSRLVEAKFGQGEPRLVGMAAAAPLGGGGEVRDGEMEREGANLQQKKKWKERNLFVVRRRTDVVLRPEGR